MSVSWHLQHASCGITDRSRCLILNRSNSTIVPWRNNDAQKLMHMLQQCTNLIKVLHQPFFKTVEQKAAISADIVDWGLHRSLTALITLGM